MATYAIEANKARPATREEVMEILQRAEENGFVHQITNIDGEDKILGICNCCVCSCYALRTSQLFNTQYVRIRLPRACRSGKVRCLRSVRRGVPGGYHQARAEAVYEGGADRLSEAGAAG